MQRGAQRERDVIDIAETLICLAASSSFLPGRSWKWKPMSTCHGQATGRGQWKRERGMGKGQGAVASGNRSRCHAWALFTGNQSLLATCNLQPAPALQLIICCINIAHLMVAPHAHRVASATLQQWPPRCT